MNLAKFPRIDLAHLPTPFEPLPALSKHLGGPNIFVKRDDCTGLAGGGNKTRKLEYLMADALEQGADMIVTVGATQSNHVRQSIAAAAKLGLPIEVLLEKAIVRDADYANNGNVLLDHLMGAVVHECPAGGNMDEIGQKFAEKLEAQGRKPYFIPTGGSSVVGTLGYAGCAFEILEQAEQINLELDAICVASGSQGTQAGLLIGLAMKNTNIPVHGISVSRPRAELEALVFKLATKTAKYAGLEQAIRKESVICDDAYYAPGYGQANDAMIEAVRLCARIEGLLLDPVYSGKAMAGLIGRIGDGTYKACENIVFIHTGGQAALHAYRSIFSS